LHSGTFSFVPS